MTRKFMMRKLSFTILLFSILISCEKNNENDPEDFMPRPVLEVDSLDLNGDETVDFAFRILEIAATEITPDEQASIIEIVL